MHAADRRRSRVPGRTFLRRAPGSDAGGRGSGTGGWTATALVPAASAHTTRSAEDGTLPEAPHSVAVRQRHPRRLWHDRGTDGGAAVDPGAHEVVGGRRRGA